VQPEPARINLKKPGQQLYSYFSILILQAQDTTFYFIAKRFHGSCTRCGSTRKKSGLNPSFCYYKRWGVKKESGQGHKPMIPLRFSKSGDLEIEKWYAIHFVDVKKTAELKAVKQDSAKETVEGVTDLSF
jgi:hypothetical protein